MIEGIISQFTASYEQRHTNAQALKEEGKRIWGYMFASAPVEIKRISLLLVLQQRNLVPQK